MPRCLEPGQRFPLSLKGDMDKPEGERPKFFFKGCPARRHLNAAAEVDEAKTIEPAIVFLKEHLVGWENMVKDGKEIPFDKDKLDGELCDLEELWELFYGFRLGGSDRKKSE